MTTVKISDENLDRLARVQESNQLSTRNDALELVLEEAGVPPAAELPEAGGETASESGEPAVEEGGSVDAGDQAESDDEAAESDDVAATDEVAGKSVDEESAETEPAGETEPAIEEPANEDQPEAEEESASDSGDTSGASTSSEPVDASTASAEGEVVGYCQFCGHAFVEDDVEVNPWVLSSNRRKVRCPRTDEFVHDDAVIAVPDLLDEPPETRERRVKEPVENENV